jgi:ABC-type multidrug transport system ATPase subunit
VSDGASIEFAGAVARVPPVALAAFTAQLGAGIHALLGAKSDGVSIVLGLVAGRVRLRGGSVRVLGGASGDVKIRPQVAFVPLDAALPDALRVDEALLAAADIRGEPRRDLLVTLAPFGLDALARRLGRTLSPSEARSVAIAEALTSQAKVLLFEEPLAAVEPQAIGAIEAGLRARAQAGACVVVATGSARDARALGDDVFTFERGTLLRRAPASDPLVLAGPRGASVRVVVGGGDPNRLRAGAERLAASLAGEGAVSKVAADEDTLVVAGADVREVTRAIARASLRENVSIQALRPEVLRDDELRAAIAGDTAGAYRAAYERALGPAPRAQVAPAHPGDGET